MKLIYGFIFFFCSFCRSKFSFKVQVYMLELYVDRLIDLLAPAGKEVSFKVQSTPSND